MGSFRKESPDLFGLNNLSMYQHRCWTIFVRSVGLPWQVEIKLSIYIHLIRGYHPLEYWNLVPTLVVHWVGGAIVRILYRGGVFFQRYGGEICLVNMYSLSKSVTVYVAIKKYVALSKNPIGNNKWKPMSCSSMGLGLGRRKYMEGVFYN